MWQYRVTPNTLVDGDIATGLLDAKGNLKVTLVQKDGVNGTTAQSPSDAQANSAGLVVNDQELVFNGTTWDRARGGVGDGSARTGMQNVISTLYNGSTQDLPRTPNVFKAITVAIGTEVTIWTPAAGKKFRLMGFVLALDTAADTITFRDNTAGTILVNVRAAQNATVSSPPMGNGILSAAANNVLTATGGVANNLRGFVFGTEE